MVWMTERGRIVRFRNPEDKTMNLLRLMPVLLLPVALTFAGYVGYLYFTGQSEDALLLGIASAAAVYFAIRSFVQLKAVFVFGDDDDEEGQ